MTACGSLWLGTWLLGTFVAFAFGLSVSSEFRKLGYGLAAVAALAGSLAIIAYANGWVC